MEFMLKVDYANVEVCVDDYERGELDYVNSFDLSDLEGNCYSSADALIKDVNMLMGAFSDKKEDYVYIDGRIDTDALVNSDNEEPTPDEINAWKQGELTLYNAHLFMNIIMVPTGGEHDMTAEEAEAFGIPLV